MPALAPAAAAPVAAAPAPAAPLPLPVDAMRGVRDIRALSDRLGVSSALYLGVSDVLKLQEIIEEARDSAQVMDALQRLLSQGALDPAQMERAWPAVLGAVVAAVGTEAWMHGRDGALSAAPAGMPEGGADGAPQPIVPRPHGEDFALLLGLCVHRLAEEGPGRIRYTMSTTGWASLLSTVTTIASFLSLFIATNQGVRSLGTIIVLGLVMVAIAAFVSVPIGWMLVWRANGSLKPDDS